MKNLILSVMMLICLSANSQNSYRIYSKLGLDLLEPTSEFDDDPVTVRVTNMTVDSAVHTKWESGAKTDTRSRDEMRCICIDGYITFFDFNKKTGFYEFDVSTKTGSTIKCYIPTYVMDDIADDESMSVEDTRAMFRVQEQYDNLLANNYKDCKDGLLDLSMWNDLDVGKRYKIAEKNKVRIFGFLLFNKNNKAEMYPVIKFIWNQPTVEEMKKRDGI